MTDVYHEGELAVQKMAGVEIIAERNSRSINEHIPKGAVAFLGRQSLVITASVDERGRVWSSIITGEPGFLYVNDKGELVIRSSPVLGDPLIQNLNSNNELGLLVIDLSKRIRLRINGTGSFDENGWLVITTTQVYGNCPKYIQNRYLHANGVYQRLQSSECRSQGLSPEQQDWIRKSDTFFIGSVSAAGDVDASHRGGPPGFVQVMDERTLIIPDYFGNSMFNTLGNIYSNPSTGLLFIDFLSGHSLQLTGRSEISWDENKISKYPAAERLLVFKVDEVLFVDNGTDLSWEFVEYSPSNPGSVEQ
ncbi:MAG: pyridoxamine 5'-phosphate oxidase family protein [Candidatus Pristimantibacillus sp.]